MRIQKLSIQVLFLIIFMGQSIYAQTDSLARDSLNQKLQQTSDLLESAITVHEQDSLEQAELLRQIEDLKAIDEQKKEELEKRLDSMKLAQDEREKKIRQQVDSARSSLSGAPVLLFNDTLFYIYSKLGPFSPEERAKNISEKLENLADEHIFDPESLTIFEGLESHDILHEEMVILSITDRDAFWLDKSREEVAENYRRIIIQEVANYYEETGLFQLLLRIGLVILVILTFVLGIKYLNKGFTWINKFTIAKSKDYLNGLKFRNYEFLSSEQEERVLTVILRVIKWIAIAFLIYISLPIVFSIFPATKGIATTLLSYFLNPVKDMGLAILNFIPELITIFVILALTHYFLRFLKFLTHEVQVGKLQIPGFYPDWAQPTFNLLRIVIYAFSFIIIFPYLPGSDSPVFRGVSVFLGVLFSLGSSSAISNIIAGLVITYMRAFKVGDRVKIGDSVGDVIDKTMLVTRLRTIKNEEVTIPNSAILNGSTINYSSSARDLGLILNTTVTIGYDIPWRRVHEILINAAESTDLIDKERRPFVLQTSLDDFYVSYQLNAHTREAAKAAKIYSDLHSNIQDGFNKAKIEILSPHYQANRDGSDSTIDENL